MGGFLSAPGPLELLVILVIALIVLGPKKLPEAARSVGRSMRELRESIQGVTEPDPYEDYEPEAERDKKPVADDEHDKKPVANDEHAKKPVAN